MISVIIPAYNAEMYIEDCLNSVLEQTYKDFEIWVINDGSIDATESIVIEYCNSDSRIHLVNQKNKGVSIARNEGIQKSNGEYIYFLDADDRINSITFEVCMKAFESNHIIDFVTFDAVCIYNNSYANKVSDSYLKFMDNFYKRDELFGNESVLVNTNEFFDKCLINSKFKGNVVLCMFKSNIIKTNSIVFNKDLNFYEDLIFLFNLSSYLKNVLFIPKQLYERRLTGESAITNEKNDIKVLNNALKSLEYIENEYNKVTVYNQRKFVQMLIIYLIRVIINYYVKCLMKNCKNITLTNSEVTNEIIKGIARERINRLEITEVYKDKIEQLLL